jgi:hypothetical protein
VEIEDNSTPDTIVNQKEDKGTLQQLKQPNLHKEHPPIEFKDFEESVKHIVQAGKIVERKQSLPEVEPDAEEGYRATKAGVKKFYPEAKCGLKSGTRGYYQVKAQTNKGAGWWYVIGFGNSEKEAWLKAAEYIGRTRGKRWDSTKATTEQSIEGLEVAKQVNDKANSKKELKVASLENNVVSECPYCGEVFNTARLLGDNDINTIALTLRYEKHLGKSEICRKAYESGIITNERASFMDDSRNGKCQSANHDYALVLGRNREESNMIYCRRCADVKVLAKDSEELEVLTESKD